jgi:hypothetical protein
LIFNGLHGVISQMICLQRDNVRYWKPFHMYLGIVHLEF